MTDSGNNLPTAPETSTSVSGLVKDKKNLKFSQNALQMHANIYVVLRIQVRPK